MNWEQRDIYHWAKEKFGESSPEDIAIRMNKEFAELLSALHNKKYDEAMKEIPDIFIFLAQCAEALGVDIQESVNTKMTINTKRKWQKMPDGSFQHIPTPGKVCD